MTKRRLRIAVTGSHGAIGSAFLQHARLQGHDVLPIVRGEPRRGELSWRPDRGLLNANQLEGLDAVVHLAGCPIGHRWSPSRKRLLVESRVGPTRLLAQALTQLDNPPGLVCASGVGFYGTHGDEAIDEATKPGDNFRSDTVVAWEHAAQSARDAGIPVSNGRFGFVLSREAVTLRKMLPFFWIGLGGPLAGGKSWFPWVGGQDTSRAILHLAATRATGPFNIVGPTPATQGEFAAALGAALHRPARLALPRWVVRSAFGRMGTDILLASQRLQPRRLLESGFSFEETNVATAIATALDAT